MREPQGHREPLARRELRRFLAAAAGFLEVENFPKGDRRVIEENARASSELGAFANRSSQIRMASVVMPKTDLCKRLEPAPRRSASAALWTSATEASLDGSAQRLVVACPVDNVRVEVEVVGVIEAMRSGTSRKCLLSQFERSADIAKLHLAGPKPGSAGRLPLQGPRNRRARASATASSAISTVLAVCSVQMPARPAARRPSSFSCPVSSWSSRVSASQAVGNS